MEVVSAKEKIYDTVFSHIKKRTLGVEDLLQLTTAVMELVQKAKGMSGSEKKEAVLSVILRAVDSKLVPKKIRETCREFIKIALPKTIDLLVSAYRHDIDLKKLRSQCKCLPLGKS